MSTSSETADIPTRSSKLLPVGLALSLPLIVVLKMGFLFLLIGMLPTMLAVTFARGSKPYVVSIVAAFNFAGVFPDQLSLFFQGGTLRAVIDRLSDVTVWGSMYGAALLGWALVWLSPLIALMVLENLYSGRMRNMENMQKKLEEEWGKQLSGRE